MRTSEGINSKMNGESVKNGDGISLQNKERQKRSFVKIS